jgi:Conserved hypothetical protein (Lin0512_fam)
MSPGGGKTGLEEKNAAVALAGFAKKASDSGLPNNASSRKQWDRVPAAPATDHGIPGAHAPAAAYLPPSASATADSQAPAAASPASRPPGVPTSSVAQRTVNQALSTALVPPQWPRQPYQHSHYPPYSYQPPHQAPSPATGTQRVTVEATAQANIHQMNSSQPAVLMSMSSFGFGVAPATAGDATEAAIRAVQDSMERSSTRLPTSSALRAQLTIHIKLGVPPKPTGETMDVDVSRLSLFLPQSIPLLPVEIVVGGLLVDHREAEGSPTIDATGSSHPNSMICTTVACVTLQQYHSSVTASSEQASNGAYTQAIRSADPGTTKPGTTTDTLHSAPSTWDGAASAPSVPPPVPPLTQHHRTASQPLPSAYHHHPPQHHVTASTHQHQHHPHRQVHRSNSMEVLAQISGELRDRQFGNASAPSQALQRLHSATALAMVCSAEAKSLSICGEANMGDREYNYKKLAPGVTPKNNKRLFVKHDYRDYSHEEPLPEEQFLVGNEALTPNAAFPLKLHEALQQVRAEKFVTRDVMTRSSAHSPTFLLILPDRKRGAEQYHWMDAARTICK